MVDGRSQCAYIPKEDVASPTTALEPAILINVINPKEGQDMGIGDVQKTFLHTDNKEDT